MVPSKNSKTAHFPLKLLLCCKNKDIILKTVSFPKNSPKQKDLRRLANVWPMCFNGTMEVSCIKWPETSCPDFYLIQFCLPFHGKGKKNHAFCFFLSQFLHDLILPLPNSGTLLICTATTGKKHFLLKFSPINGVFSPFVRIVLLVLNTERAHFTDPKFWGYFKLLVSTKW